MRLLLGLTARRKSRCIRLLPYTAIVQGLNDTLLGRARTSADQPGQKAALSDAIQNYATELANNEIDHVRTTPALQLCLLLHAWPRVFQSMHACMHAVVAPNVSEGTCIAEMLGLLQHGL